MAKGTATMAKLEFCRRFVYLNREPIRFDGRPYLPAVYASAGRDLVLRCSRQTEKSTFLANTILYEACVRPGIEILLVCPRLQVGVLLLHPPLNPALDNWLVFRGHDLDTLPTNIPLELGPPRTASLRQPVARVIVAPDASPALAAALARMARCPAKISSMGLTVYPATCLPVLRPLGNVLRIPSHR